ncbi:MauE/DoxX family redox-associated membrane protein [Pseudonocardia sp. HH130629-09]|uniref:MauE/DoxX family redox-associated membrane protein n=1 Tax=Pseudonocardia sp. HH130629-09 TaxID=1641402 RepID=UPI0006CB7522|nr:MauE/DoxX family redox-associated membrane protein [Pseudonocardia sp. HH130629-09]ALE85080.1 DoxX family protein [Pseudonocardia sp. HH130629-09]
MTAARPLDVLGTVLRLGLAAVWLVSGAVKLSEPFTTAVAVAAYRVLPDALVVPVATLLPPLEIALGLLLLAGLATRLAAVVGTVLLLAFVAGLVQAWARGLSIDCGCFGGGGPVDPEDTRYGLSLLRDLAFLGTAVFLTVRPRTLFALDGRGDRAAAHHHDRRAPVNATEGR